MKIIIFYYYILKYNNDKKSLAQYKKKKIEISGKSTATSEEELERLIGPH